MENLFLVRKNLERFLGPMTLQEFEFLLKKMEIGSDDEVSGNCLPWVFLKEMGRLKTIYPQLAKIIQRETAQSWGVSEHDEKLISQNSKNRQNKFSFATYLFGFVSLIFGVLIILYSEEIKKIWYQKFNKIENEARVIQGANFLIENSRWNDFENLLNKYYPRIHIENDDFNNLNPQWHPILRAYAFKFDKELDSPFQPLLKNETHPMISTICNAKNWSKKITQSPQIFEALVNGKRILNQDMVILFLLDPFLISSRKEEGWVYPKNYIHACLLGAEFAVTAMEDALLKSPLLARILEMKQKIENMNNPQVVEWPLNSPFYYLSCWENAKSLNDLIPCNVDFKNQNFEEPWPAILEVRQIYALLNKMNSEPNKNILDPKELNLLKEKISIQHPNYIWVKRLGYEN